MAHAIAGDRTASGPFAYLVAGQWQTDGIFLDYRVVHPDGQLGPFGSLTENWDSGFLEPHISKSAWRSSSGTKHWVLGYTYWETFLFHQAHTILVDQTGAKGAWSAPGIPGRLAGVSTPLDADGDEPIFAVVGSPPGGTPGLVRVQVVRGGSPLPGSILTLETQGNEGRIESDGSSFVATYTAFDQPGTSEVIWAATLRFASDALGLDEQIPTSTLGQVSRASALVSERGAGGGAYQRFLIAWQQLAGSVGDIIGARYDTPSLGLRYCQAAPNSVGPGARIEASGSISIHANAFELAVTDCPPQQVGMFYCGETSIRLPFGDGFRCIGGATARIHPILTTDSLGEAVTALDFDQHYGALVVPGTAGVRYQFWYRDPAGGPAGFNLSDALLVHHTP